jgi:demethylmenaquinone methyltransferase/2-methoxy-6-polyprenyl-1,4-benzoquinol methylase
VGIDFCEKMLNKAKNKKIELALADAESLPFPDNTFDCAAIGFGLRNVTNVKKTLQEMTRVVKAGGRVVCLEFALPQNGLFGKIYHFFLYDILPPIAGLISRRRDAYKYLPRSIAAFLKPEELKRILEEVGLEDIQIYTLTWGVSTVHVGIKAANATKPL